MIENTSRFYVGTRSDKGAGLFLQPLVKRRSILRYTITTKAVGGWGYQLDVSKDQARQILEARNGEVIYLDGSEEKISIPTDDDYIGHERKTPEGRTWEDLDAEDFRETLRDFLNSELEIGQD